MMSASMTDYPVNDRGRCFDPSVSDDHRTYALLTHLTLLAHSVIPYISIAIAIAMWQIKKKDSPFVDDHGREAVNFQLSLILYSFALPAIAAIIGVLTLGVGFLLMLPAIALPFVLGLVGMVMGVIAANRGEYFRYPMTIRFIS